MTENVWDNAPDANDDKYWLVSARLPAGEKEFLSIQFSMDMGAWMARAKAHYRKPVSVLQQWERHFGEVTSDIKTGHNMKELKEKADAMLRFRKVAENLGEGYADLTDKLEAVKAWFDDSKIELKSADIRTLRKILEADQSIGDSTPTMKKEVEG